MASGSGFYLSQGRAVLVDGCYREWAGLVRADDSCAVVIVEGSAVLVSVLAEGQVLEGCVRGAVPDGAAAAAEDDGFPAEVVAAARVGERVVKAGAVPVRALGSPLSVLPGERGRQRHRLPGTAVAVQAQEETWSW